MSEEKKDLNETPKPEEVGRADEAQAQAEGPRVEEPGSETRPVKEDAAPEVQTIGKEADQPPVTMTEDEAKEAKAKAAAEARAARAAAREAAKKAEAGEAAADAPPKEPSPKQPVLDRFVQLLKEELGEQAIQEAWINERDDHLPCVVLETSLVAKAAEFLNGHHELKLTYLRNLAGSDLETHMEVIYHILRLEDMQEYCIKVKADRQAPVVPSVTPVWGAADWNEREVYDLLGIEFTGHPNLVRIMMSDNWVGHPLRKDYEPLDPEV
ncbi:NADH-quinone oxidoreductase subunit C [Gorillibacterium sp. sgz5001074]|uniref:NADH-quinone oxidoreductase subunit C n=1 Tax=Gorillibacterium sp. sgz5001074 TaxID=3446695 RepID=UPI003F662C23